MQPLSSLNKLLEDHIQWSRKLIEDHIKWSRGLLEDHIQWVTEQASKIDSDQKPKETASGNAAGEEPEERASKSSFEKNIVAGYKAVENGVVSGYKKIEDSVVTGYKKIEDKFVDTFLSGGAAEEGSEE